jgi:ankyrin repeat protein
VAAARGRLAAVVFLAEEADPSAAALQLRDRHGSTPLHYSATHGHLDVVDWIATRRPELLAARNDHGDTAAHCAAQAGELETLRLLVSRDPSALLVENSVGLRPVDLAAPHPACLVFLRGASAEAEDAAMAAAGLRAPPSD